MRVAVWGAVSTVLLNVAASAASDVYLIRTRTGARVYTNAPVQYASRIYKDQPIPPAPEMFVRRSLAMIGRTPVPAPVPTSYDALIREIADRYNVEYALVKAVIKAESDFDYRAVSPKGALGLMQLMPQTAALHQVRNVFLPRDNIEGGCRHLRMLLDRYGGNLPLTIAAYNAGTRRVEEAGGIPPIPETREYLARVLRYRIAYLREGAGVIARR